MEADGSPSQDQHRLLLLPHTITDKEWAVILPALGQPKLSPQQGLIVKLMLTLPHESNTNAGIALALGCKESCVKTQIERIFEKLRAVGVQSRMHLSQRVDTELCILRGWMNGPT